MALVGASWRARYASFRSGWGYILLLTLVVGGWIAWNLQPWLPHYDEFPFILLNLLLSVEAAYAMPVLLMEQFKVAAEDRALLKAGLAGNRDMASHVRAILRAVEELEKEERDAQPPE